MDPLTNTVAELLKLIRVEHCWVNLGKEIVDPEEEGILLDIKGVARADKDTGDGEAGLLAMDAFLVSPSSSTGRVVGEAEMGSIGTSIRNQIINHFLFHFIPKDMDQVEDFGNLVFGVGIIVAGTAGCATAESGKPVLGFVKVCRSWPVLFFPHIIRIWKRRHGVGYKI